MGSRTVVFKIVRLPYLVWVEGRGIKNTLAKKVLVDSLDTQSHDPLFVFLPIYSLEKQMSLPLLMERVTDFIFLGSKITADGDGSHEIKTRLLLGRKAMTNLDSILKSRDITLSTKVHLVKLWFFQ